MEKKVKTEDKGEKRETGTMYVHVTYICSMA